MTDRHDEKANELLSGHYVCRRKVAAALREAEARGAKRLSEVERELDELRDILRPWLGLMAGVSVALAEELRHRIDPVRAEQTSPAPTTPKDGRIRAPIPGARGYIGDRQETDEELRERLVKEGDDTSKALAHPPGDAGKCSKCGGHGSTALGRLRCPACNGTGTAEGEKR